MVDSSKVTQERAQDSAPPESPHPAEGDLAEAIIRRVQAVLRTEGGAGSRAACRIETDGRALTVHFDLPFDAGPDFRQALAVRVLDVIHSQSTRTFGEVRIRVHCQPNIVEGGSHAA